MTTILLRRDTSANWVSINPVLLSGEIGIDLTSDCIKIGDGVTAWNSLTYMDSTDPENVITVAESGGQFVSIKDALDSITDNGPSKRYTIQVAPGIYTEDNPIQAKEYVNLSSIGDLQTTRIVAANPNEDLIIMTNFFTLEGFTFWGVTGASNYILNQSVAGISSVVRCAFAESTNGILINHANTDITVTDCAVYNLTATTIKGIYCQAGNININRFIASLGNITTLVEVTGTNSTASLNGIRGIISTLTTGIIIGDLADVDINDARLQDMATGIEVDGGAKAHISTTRISDATVDGFRVNDVGANTEVSIQGVVIEGSIGFDINLLSATCLLSGNLHLSLNNTNFIEGAKVYVSIMDLQEDDEGFNILGELHVGVAESGTESVFGEGDSYTRGMLVYSQAVGGAFTDRSTEARSASSSPFTFDGIVAENAIYIGSLLENNLGSLEHFGIKTKTLTAAVLGAGSIVFEYWGGSSWIEFNAMEVGSDGAYFPHAKNYFQDTGGHHIRYSQNLASDTWTRNDPMSLGTNYFWVRVRITADITTAPIFEQFKLHTNRFEVNSDGWIEYFGKARPTGRLGWEFGVLEKAGGAGDDRDLYLGDTLDVGMKKNRFDNNKVARVGFNTVLPMDLDTSSPITFSWNIIAEGTGTADVDWILRWGYSKDGDNIYPESGHADPASLQTYSVSLPAPGTDTSKWYSTTLDVSEMVSRRDGGFPDTLWFTISRDGTADDYAGTISVIGISANYTKWCEGGHV